MNSAASSSAEPPISPTITISSVSGSASNSVDDVDEARARHRVAADADDRRVAEAAPAPARCRSGRSACPSARRRRRCPRSKNCAGMMPTLALPGRQDAGAVRADQARRPALRAQVVVDAQLVVGGDALGDRDDRARCRRPRPRGSSRRRSAAGTKIIAVFAPVSVDRVVERCRRPGCPRRPGRPCRASRRRRPSCRSRGCAARGTCPRGR